MADYASESGHWYCLDGTPCYTIKGANGKERPTTLRDARKLGLLPSVTGIIALAAKPGLEKWKREQTLLSALTLPRVEGETDASFMARVEEDSKEQAKRAAEKGEEVHAAIDRYYRKELVSDRWQPWLAEASGAIQSVCGIQKWLAERCYAHSNLYGCRIDLHSDEWLIDVKTKEALTPVTMAIYDEHLMQLAANALATKRPIKRHGILFVNRKVAAAELVEVKIEDISRGMEMFWGLFKYWQAKTGHIVELEKVIPS